MRLIYSAHNLIINSARPLNASGMFEQDGFLGRYERLCDVLDSNFCSVKLSSIPPSIDTPRRYIACISLQLISVNYPAQASQQIPPPPRQPSHLNYPLPPQSSSLNMPPPSTRNANPCSPTSQVRGSRHPHMTYSAARV